MIDKDDLTLLPDMGDKQFEKDVLLLEQDLDVLGWDQPNILYAVMGEPGDYRLEKISEMSGHPVDWMRSAVCGTENHPGGGRLSDDVQGVAVANEGWRHPHAEDFERHYPEDWAMFTQLAEVTGVTDRTEMLHHINQAIGRLHEMIAPSDNPRRMEIRSVIVLMRNGSGMGVHRTRGEEAETFQMAAEGRVMRGMKALLTGCWPNDPEMNEPTPDRK